MADPIIITAIAVIITVITVAVMCRGQGTTSRNHPNTNIKNTKKTAANTAGTTTAVTTITTIDPGQESGKRLNHKTTADLRNRHPEGLHLGLVLGGGFCYSPLIVEPDYTLTA